MPNQLLDEARVYRQAFKVASFAEAEELDRQCWRSRPPDGRFAAPELIR